MVMYVNRFVYCAHEQLYDIAFAVVFPLWLIGRSFDVRLKYIFPNVRKYTLFFEQACPVARNCSDCLVLTNVSTLPN